MTASKWVHIQKPGSTPRTVVTVLCGKRVGYLSTVRTELHHATCQRCIVEHVLMQPTKIGA